MPKKPDAVAPKIGDPVTFIEHRDGKRRTITGRLVEITGELAIVEAFHGEKIIYRFGAMRLVPRRNPNATKIAQLISREVVTTAGSRSRYNATGGVLVRGSTHGEFTSVWVDMDTETRSLEVAHDICKLLLLHGYNAQTRGTSVSVNHHPEKE